MIQSNVAFKDADSELLRRSHVLIDARKIRHGGIGRYIRNLLALSPSLWGRVSAIVPPDISSAEIPAEITLHRSAIQGYSLSELFTLGRKISWDGVDLFHCPHFTVPFFVPVPTVVTVHDLIQITHPQHWWYPHIARRMVNSALARADSIIAVSTSTQKELERLWPRAGWAKEVRVVPNVIPRFDGVTQAKQQSQRRYLLAVLSNNKPHKGVQRLLEAFGQLRDLDLDLILAGYGSTGMPAGDRIQVRGAVSDSELAQLYGGAQALVVASSVEGFCLPVLEAQSVGTPVITTPVPAVLELLTARDRSAADFSAHALSQAIRAQVQAASTQENVNCNVQHLQKFSSDVVAAQLREIYCATLQRGKARP